MLHANLLTDSILDLEVTTRVCGRNNLRSRFSNAGSLLFLQFCGRFRLGDVVDTCASTAMGGVSQFDQFDPGYGIQNLP